MNGCLFAHARSNEERKEVMEMMDYARRIGDAIGIAVCLSRLSKCKNCDG